MKDIRDDFDELLDAMSATDDIEEYDDVADSNNAADNNNNIHHNNAINSNKIANEVSAAERPSESRTRPGAAITIEDALDSVVGDGGKKNDYFSTSLDDD